ncbi:MAG: deoxyribodipyrimidine photo-lyase [Oscillatoriales cyanobacterium SM2_3_0]|nr:deoxyribodipyrimidine photo-lyase [Oscillatoriales cyanobacterium SM2_3_0]
MNRTIVWFRRDLRIFDHAPLYRAAQRGEVVPVFIFDSALLHHPETGSARVAFMLECLRSLDQDLQERGGRLILRTGNPVEVLPQLLRETAAEGIYAYIDYERIYGRVRDGRLNQMLGEEQMKIRWFEPTAGTSSLLSYPQYRNWWFAQMQQPMSPTPERIRVPENLGSQPLPTLADLNWMEDGKPIPPAGTTGARQLLQDFLDHKTRNYYWQLSYPSAEATTGLSPHIKFGAISVRECYQMIQAYPTQDDTRIERSKQQAIARLRWGVGFAQRFRYLPQLELRSLYRVFDQDGWEFDPELYQAWKEGRTGFPIVDAAARCLKATGGLQGFNFRTRAIYASFLGNLLGMDWRYGALHFMEHLIDGDCPIDHYQWAMQTGVTHCIDKTWTRIYNPGQMAVDRCDPEGLFIKRWLPELTEVAPKNLGNPPRINNYPGPILDYKAARKLRVEQLQRQRSQFLGQENVLEFLARLPEDLTPFSREGQDCDVRWARESTDELFPKPLDLAGLNETQARALRTWFVAHVDIKPPQQRRRRPQQQPQSNEFVQLCLPI